MDNKESILQEETNISAQNTDFRFFSTINDLKPHDQLSKWIDDHDILVYFYQGELKALSNICPHFGGPVGYRKAKDGLFTCLWHNWQFSCKDGSCLTHPGLPLREYQVELRGEDIYINLLG